MRFRVKRINLVLIATSKPKASDATFSSQVCYFKFLGSFQAFQLGEPKFPSKYAKTGATICYQNQIALFALSRKQIWKMEHVKGLRKERLRVSHCFPVVNIYGTYSIAEYLTALMR